MSDSNERVELDVQVDFAEYWRATLGFMLRNWRLKLVIVGAAISLLGFLFIIIRFPHGDPPYQLLVVPGALVVLAPILYFNTKAVFASKKFLQGKVRYVFADDGVEASAESSPGFTKWESIPKAIELKSDFLVFYTRDRMYTLPKSCFESGQQMAALRNLLKSHLGDKAVLLSD